VKVSRSFEQIRPEVSASYNQKPCSYFGIASLKNIYFGLTPLCFEHLYVIPVTECRWKWLVRLVTEFECDMPEPVFEGKYESLKNT
jgi:hypothetical protein